MDLNKSERSRSLIINSNDVLIVFNILNNFYSHMSKNILSKLRKTLEQSSNIVYDSRGSVEEFDPQLTAGSQKTNNSRGKLR